MPAQIPELAKQNFPLCMKYMQEVTTDLSLSPTLIQLEISYQPQ